MNRKIICCILALLFCFNVTLSMQQTDSRMGKSGLLSSLNAAKNRGMVNDSRYVQRLVEEIEKYGVNFQMSRMDEAELRAAGANYRIVEAVRRNYRPIRPKSTPTPTPSPTPTPPIGPSLTGPPLSFGEILEWLQKGALNTYLRTVTQARRVNFILEEAEESQLAHAGADRELIATIKKFATTEVIGIYYDNLIRNAEELMEANKWAAAEPLIKKAIELNSTKPEAYRLRGEANLYKVARQYAEAEKDMVESLKLGGKASFRVFYTCGGKKPCSGKLLVDKDSFTFKPLSSPAWTIRDDQITNMGVGTKDIKKDAGGFWIATNIREYDVKRQRLAKTPNVYDFQAYSMSLEEANLIIKIIKNY